MPFPCAKTIQKSNQTSTFSMSQVRKSFKRNRAPFASKLMRSSNLRQTYTYSMFSAFRHQRYRQDLVWVKNDSKRGTSNHFQPTLEVPSGPSEGEKQVISRRGKRNLKDESDLKFPKKSPRVSSDVALKDHDYIFPCKENSSPTEKNIHGKKVCICFLPKGY